MEHFNNISENFFREIRKVEIYKSDDVNYIENYNGEFPPAEVLQYAFDVTPEDFTRKLSRKTRNGNYFHDVDLGFPLLKMDKTNVEKYQNYFNKKAFSVVLVSNTDKILLGNQIEPLKIEVLDNRKDNASGNDEYYLSITGETIIDPKILMI